MMRTHLQRIVILATCASLVAASGCASRGVSPVRIPQAASAGRSTAGDPELAPFLRTLPPGTPLRVRLQGGERFTATLLGFEGEDAILKPRGRVPEPSRRVPLSEFADAEVREPGTLGAGRAVLIGAAVGAGAFVGLLLVFAAAVADSSGPYRLNE